SIGDVACVSIATTVGKIVAACFRNHVNTFVQPFNF
ncbi:MAG: hypothetical protein ACI92E_002921, partial [Oceanicoccus sp.]